MQTRLETEIAALHSQLDAIPRALDAAEQALAGCLGVRATLEARHAVLIAHVPWPSLSLPLSNPTVKKIQESNRQPLPPKVTQK